MGMLAASMPPSRRTAASRRLTTLGRNDVRIGVPREYKPGETRVAATPKTVGQLIDLGYEVLVEAGAGASSAYPDGAYVEAGARVVNAVNVWASDIVIKVNAPDDTEIGSL